MADNKKIRKKFNRLLKKYNVSLEFLVLNLKNIYKYISYAREFHIVFKKGLIVKTKRAIIKYNKLRKRLISPKNLNIKRKSNESWTIKIVRYLKNHAKQKEEDVKLNDNKNLPLTEIHENLQKQLNILTNLKKFIPPPKNISKNTECITELSKALNWSNKKFFKKHCKYKRRSERTAEGSETEEYESSALIEYEKTKQIYKQKKNRVYAKGNFVDNLMHKMTKNSMIALPSRVMNTASNENTQYNINSDVSDLEIIKTEMDHLSEDELIIPDYIAPNKMNVRNAESVKKKISEEIILPDEAEDASSNSSDFLGFQDHELVPVAIPGMLATPLVNNPLRDVNHSAFQSEELDKFLSENSRGTQIKEIKLPVFKKYEEGLVCDGSTPPKMVMPIVPEELVKSRTVAQKRNYLQKKQSIKYYMIENENTVYRELMKRTRAEHTNINLILCVQEGQVPCTRDCWKATAWLRTENGRFYFQALKVDNTVVKLTGARGNHSRKYIMSQLSTPKQINKQMGCSLQCRKYINLRNISINLPPEANDDDDLKVKLNKRNISATSPDVKPSICAIDTKPICKPGPLSTKYLATPFEPNLGGLEVFEMPGIHLEVFPKINKPLDECVKPYLKHILPSKCITRQWAEFAVSTLQTKSNQTSSMPKSFTFTVPYLNNQRNLLVRKIYNRKEKLEKLSTDDFEFRNIVDRNDEIAEECADVLSDMINSVAIGLSEDSLIQNDPDIDYENNAIKVSTETIKEENVAEKSLKQKHFLGRKRTSRKRLLLELKKLNATIIDAESLYTAESPENKKCHKPHCRLDCICHSLSSQPIMPQHCNKIECMFECSCDHSMDLSCLKNTSLSTADALLIRKKATARLAKVEKEFCSTVVLTDRETYLINDPIKERKRSKRAPKRFDDYDTTEKNDINTDIVNWLPPKSQSTDKEVSQPTKLQNPIKLQDLQHCQVNLVQLSGLDRIEPWCMVHCLYKCFCKGNTVTGVPFEIKKENFVKAPTIRPHKLILNEQFVTNTDEIDPLLIEIEPKRRKIEAERREVADEINNESKKRITVQEMNAIRNYRFYVNERCKRVCVIPTMEYKKLNKQRAGTIRKKIQNNENEKMALILEKKIGESLKYPISNVHANPLTKNNIKNKPKETLRQPDEPRDEPSKTVEQDSVITSSMINNSSDDKFPIITSVCSLSATHDNNYINTKSIDSIQVETKEESESSISTDEFTIPIDGSSKKHSSTQNSAHSWAIQKLNAAVTRTMHSICSIQKKNTKHIPSPVPFTLSSHQWQLFLQAYIEGLVHVWEIRIKRGTFYAATVVNIMPIVPDALSVININMIEKNKLPLLGQMLNARFINDKTKTLSVLLSGQRHYWRIVGFINSSYDYLNRGGVFKPTPESHPWLSKKINTLCRLLVARSIQANNMKTNVATKNSSNSNNTPQGSSNMMTSVMGETEGALATAPKSNLEIRKVCHKEIEGIVIPIAVQKDHKWLLIDLIDDFSHIYIPAWKNFLSHVRIKNAILLTRTTKKIVRIGQNNFNISVFATTDPHKRLYLGPYNIDEQPDLILYQNISGKMMLREDYEKCYNINRNLRTNGFWLYKKCGKLIFDMNMSTLVNIKTPIVTLADGGTLIDEQEQLDEKIELDEDKCVKIISDKEENSMQSICDESSEILDKSNDENTVEEDPLKIPEDDNQETKFFEKEISFSDELKPEKIIKSPSSTGNNGVSTIKLAKFSSLTNPNTKYLFKNLAKKPKISEDSQLGSATPPKIATETSKTVIPSELPLQSSIPKATTSFQSQSWRCLSPPNDDDVERYERKMQKIMKPIENNEEPKKIMCCIKPGLNSKKPTYILKSTPNGKSTVKQIIISPKEVKIRPVTSSTVTGFRPVASSTITAPRSVTSSTVTASCPVTSSTVVPSTSGIFSKCSSEIEIKRVPIGASKITVKPILPKNETLISCPGSSNVDKLPHIKSISLPKLPTRLTPLSKQKILARSKDESTKMQVLKKVPFISPLTGKIMLPAFKSSNTTQSSPINSSSFTVVNSKPMPVETVQTPSPTSDGNNISLKPAKSQPIFGYTVSDNPDFSTLIIPTKKVDDVYLLKIPFVRGVMRITGMNAVHTHLNEDYLLKFQDRYPTKNRLASKWKFEPLKNSDKANNSTQFPSNTTTSKLNNLLILNKPDECNDDGDKKLNKLKNFTIMKTACERPMKVPKQEPPEKRRKIVLQSKTATMNSRIERKTISSIDVDQSDDQTSDLEICEPETETILISDDDDDY